MVGRPHSEECRRRVLEEVAEGNSPRGAAKRVGERALGIERDERRAAAPRQARAETMNLALLAVYLPASCEKQRPAHNLLIPKQGVHMNPMD